MLHLESNKSKNCRKHTLYNRLIFYMSSQKKKTLLRMLSFLCTRLVAFFSVCRSKVVDFFLFTLQTVPKDGRESGTDLYIACQWHFDFIRAFRESRLGLSQNQRCSTKACRNLKKKKKKTFIRHELNNLTDLYLRACPKREHPVILYGDPSTVMRYITNYKNSMTQCCLF